MARQPQPIVPPWKGIITDLPSLMAPPSSFRKESFGWWIDKQRLKTWPNSKIFALPPNNECVYGMRTFQDAVGNLHTVFMTPDQLYYWTGTAYDAQSINPVATLANPNPAPFSSDVFQNVLFCCNGWGYPQGIDGSADSIQVTNGGVGSCYFVGKLAGRLLLLNLVEPAPGELGIYNFGSVNYGRRFRWSKVNDGTNYTDPSAGSADIPEVEDNITGYATQGPLGYVYRNNGITVLTPTGGLTPAFYIENYVSGPVGVGCSFPYCLGQYGNLTCFPGLDDIYSFNPLIGPPQPIGGGCRDQIFKDLYAGERGIGALIPNWTNGVVNLTYWLCIPSGLSTIIWLYSFESQTWMRVVDVSGSMLAVANLAVA